MIEALTKNETKILTLLSKSDRNYLVLRGDDCFLKSGDSTDKTPINKTILGTLIQKGWLAESYRSWVMGNNVRAVLYLEYRMAVYRVREYKVDILDTHTGEKETKPFRSKKQLFIWLRSRGPRYTVVKIKRIDI